MREIGHFIGGKQVPGASGRTGNVHNPATGEVSAKVALASAAELRKAVQVAAEAFPGWAAAARRACSWAGVIVWPSCSGDGSPVGSGCHPGGGTDGGAGGRAEGGRVVGASGPDGGGTAGRWLPRTTVYSSAGA